MVSPGPRRVHSTYCDFCFRTAFPFARNPPEVRHCRAPAEQLGVAAPDPAVGRAWVPAAPGRALRARTRPRRPAHLPPTPGPTRGQPRGAGCVEAEPRSPPSSGTRPPGPRGLFEGGAAWPPAPPTPEAQRRDAGRAADEVPQRPWVRAGVLLTSSALREGPATGRGGKRRPRSERGRGPRVTHRLKCSMIFSSRTFSGLRVKAAAKACPLEARTPSSSAHLAASSWRFRTLRFLPAWESDQKKVALLTALLNSDGFRNASHPRVTGL
nr:sterile alpha motif domain-containing protein 1-like [Pan paniscus]